MSEFIALTLGIVLGFVAGMLVYRKNGKQFEVDLASAQAKAWAFKAELDALKAKLKG